MHETVGLDAAPPPGPVGLAAPGKLTYSGCGTNTGHKQQGANAASTTAPLSLLP